MVNSTEIKSTELTRLLNTYFRGIFFTPLFPGEAEEDGDTPTDFSFPDFGPYIKAGENGKNRELDIRGMAEGNNFSGLFPIKPEPEETDWINLDQWLLQTNKKSGGVIRFFIEKDDSHFIEVFNCHVPGDQKIERGKNIDLPDSFFSEMAQKKCYVLYEPNPKPDSYHFSWNFNSVLSNKTPFVFTAYQRYAHARYSCRFIDSRKTGYASIQYICREYQKTKGKQDNNYDFSYTRHALELFQDDPYTPASLEKVIETIGKEEKKFRYELQKSKKDDDPRKRPFDKKDIQNIHNYCGENPSYTGKTMPGVLSELNLDKEKAIFLEEIREDKKNKHTHNKVEELYRLITKYPEVREKFKQKTIENIHSFYEKGNMLSLNRTIGDDEESEFMSIIKDNSIMEPEEAILLQETKEFLDDALPDIFRKAFPGEDKYLEYIDRQPVLHLLRDMEPYNVKGKSNTDSKIFQDYCKIKDMKDKRLIGKIHDEVFRPRIQKTLRKLRKAAKKEGLLDN